MTSWPEVLARPLPVVGRPLRLSPVHSRSRIAKGPGTQTPTFRSGALGTPLPLSPGPAGLRDLRPDVPRPPDLTLSRPETPAESGQPSLPAQDVASGWGSGCRTSLGPAPQLWASHGPFWPAPRSSVDTWGGYQCFPRVLIPAR